MYSHNTHSTKKKKKKKIITISNENTIAIKLWYFLPEVIEISVQSGSSHGSMEQQWNSV